MESLLGGGEGVGLRSLTVAHEGIVSAGLLDFRREAIELFRYHLFHPILCKGKSFNRTLDKLIQLNDY